MWLFIWFLLHIHNDYSMIYDRNKFIIAVVSYDFIYDSFYTCCDYHMIHNRKGSEVTTSILCCIYHLFLYRWRQLLMPSWTRQYWSSRRWLTMPARQTRRVLFSRLFLPSETTSVLRTHNCGTTSENRTQLLPCVKRCHKVEGRAWSVTDKAWDTHEGEGTLQWQEPECVHFCVKWPWA